MNAYYDKTFLIDSAFIIDIKYRDDKGEPLMFDAKYTSADMILTNIENGKTLVMSGVGTISPGRVRVEAPALIWKNAPKGFLKNDISDIFGCGGKYHAYGIWLKSSVNNETLCVLRGKAKLVRGK